MPHMLFKSLQSNNRHEIYFPVQYSNNYYYFYLNIQGIASLNGYRWFNQQYVIVHNCYSTAIVACSMAIRPTASSSAEGGYRRMNWR